MNTPIRVAIYGSSLFLTAVIAVLRHHAAITLIQFNTETTTEDVMKYNPAIMVYQDCAAPRNPNRLLEADVKLLKIDSQQSVITIYQHNRMKQEYPICRSIDLISVITQEKPKGVVAYV